MNDLYASLEEKYGLPSGTLSAISNTESSDNPNTPPSSKGAEGQFQFMPETAKAYNVNVHDPKSSAEGAAHYLADLKKQYGDWQAAFAHYNGGHAAGKAVVNGKEPPASETKNYLTKVNSKMKAPEEGDWQPIDQEANATQAPEEGEWQPITTQNDHEEARLQPSDPNAIAGVRQKKKDILDVPAGYIGGATAGGIEGVRTLAHLKTNLLNQFAKNPQDPTQPSTRGSLNRYFKSQVSDQNLGNMHLSDLESEMTKLDQSLDPNAPPVKLRTMSEVQDAIKRLQPTPDTFTEKKLPRGSIKTKVPGTPGVDTSAYQVNPETPIRNSIRNFGRGTADVASRWLPAVGRIGSGFIGGLTALNDASDAQNYAKQKAAEENRPKENYRDYGNWRSGLKGVGALGGGLSMFGGQAAGIPMMAAGQIPDIYDWAKDHPHALEQALNPVGTQSKTKEVLTDPNYFEHRYNDPQNRTVRNYLNDIYKE